MENILIQAAITKKLHTTTGDMLLDVKFDVYEGETLAFFGPSGVGKTTILRILAGLTTPDSGFIKVNGEIWFDSTPGINKKTRLRPVGFMFQDYALFPHMSVRENIQFAQPIKDNVHIEQLLNLFDLVSLSGRKPVSLSGGQQQRVALARALARKPGLLLLDEPLSALDPEIRSHLQDEILETNKRLGITTILVSHDLTEVLKLSSRVIILNEGKITREGKPFEVFSQSRISGKMQLIAEVLKVEKEDIIHILTLLVGNTLVKVAVTDQLVKNYKTGDKVLIISKAFNPVIRKIE